MLSDDELEIMAKCQEIAKKYNCDVEVDAKLKIINVTGGKAIDQIDCVLEIDGFIKQYVRENIEQESNQPKQQKPADFGWFF